MSTFKTPQAPFDVTAAGRAIELGVKRTGTAAFTVTNRTGRTMHVRALAVPLGSTPAAWLSITGESERALAAGATEQFEVRVVASADAAPGSFAFRLDVVGIENPDDLSVQGPSVAFQIGKEEKPSSDPVKRGLLATAVWATIGMTVCGLVGMVPGALVALTRMTQIQLRTAVLIVAIGALIGCWLGAAGGGWAGLWLNSYRAAEPTGMLLVAFMAVPVTFGLVYVLLASPNVSAVLCALGMLVLTAGAAVGARLIVLWRLTPGGSSS